MNLCSVGDILFCWFVGIEKIGEDRYELNVETGEMIGNKGKSIYFDSNLLKLLKIKIKGIDVDEIEEGFDKLLNYFKLEFNEHDYTNERMISSLKDEYKKVGSKQDINFVRKMSCVGIELMHRDDMEFVINKGSMENDEINLIGKHFVTIKLMEQNFLRKFLKGRYANNTKEQRKRLLRFNSIRLVFPIGQLQEVVQSLKS